MWEQARASWALHHFQHGTETPVSKSGSEFHMKANQWCLRLSSGSAPWRDMNCPICFSRRTWPYFTLLLLPKVPKKTQRFALHPILTQITQQKEMWKEGECSLRETKPFALLPCVQQEKRLVQHTHPRVLLSSQLLCIKKKNKLAQTGKSSNSSPSAGVRGDSTSAGDRIQRWRQSRPL